MAWCQQKSIYENVDILVGTDIFLYPTLDCDFHKRSLGKFVYLMCVIIIIDTFGVCINDCIQKVHLAYDWLRHFLLTFYQAYYILHFITLTYVEGVREHSKVRVELVRRVPRDGDFDEINHVCVVIFTFLWFSSMERWAASLTLICDNLDTALRGCNYRNKDCSQHWPHVSCHLEALPVTSLASPNAWFPTAGLDATRHSHILTSHQLILVIVLMLKRVLAAFSKRLKNLGMAEMRVTQSEVSGCLAFIVLAMWSKTHTNRDPELQWYPNAM